VVLFNILGVDVDLRFSSVRSTNVYEEQSLGIFEEEEESDDEDDFQPTGHRVRVWSRYLSMHARRQLSFGRSFFSV
jgi:hypothetical protein